MMAVAVERLLVYRKDVEGRELKVKTSSSEAAVSRLHRKRRQRTCSADVDAEGAIAFTSLPFT